MDAFRANQCSSFGWLCLNCWLQWASAQPAQASTPWGPSCLLLPVHAVFHKHQHQQQERRVQHSTLLTKYVVERGWLVYVLKWSRRGKAGRQMERCEPVRLLVCGVVLPCLVMLCYYKILKSGSAVLSHTKSWVWLEGWFYRKCIKGIRVYTSSWLI